MRTPTTLALTLAAAAALSLAACTSSSTTGDTGNDKASPTASAQPAGLTAKQAAVKLADATGVTDLGNPQDNTGSCSNATGAEAQWNCMQLITTDTVSIYQFKTDAVAKHWVDTMKGVGNDWRQVGHFALGFSARHQQLTSDERKAELVTALKKLV